MTLDGRRVLVTGAGGMLGSAVVRALVAHGASVHAHLGPAASAVLTPPPPDVRSSYAEITDPAAVAGLVQGTDAVIHLAGPPSVAESFARPRDFALAHTVGTATVLEAAQQSAVGRLVHVSSAEVYGRPESNPVTEDARTVPRSPYGAAKLGAEAMVRAWSAAGGGEAVILRPFSVYGPASPERSLLGRLIRQAAVAERITLATLRPVRDYVHVDDVAAAVVRALVVPAAQPREYNVASGTGTSVRELAALAVAAAGRDLEIVEAVTADRPPLADLLELVADVSRARTELGWTASVPLAVGVARALAAIRLSD
jgi:UDP-glucose 4-epimerase